MEKSLPQAQQTFSILTKFKYKIINRMFSFKWRPMRKLNLNHLLQQPFRPFFSEVLY